MLRAMWILVVSLFLLLVDDASAQLLPTTIIADFLNSKLPVTLNASHLYPSVENSQIANFKGLPISLTAEDLARPLAPGDYIIPVIAFCTEYSVHRPGRGTAYQTGPLEGRLASVISNLLWRGVLSGRYTSTDLQNVAWGVQSGLSYSQMPTAFQHMIDDLVPEGPDQLKGDFFTELRNAYNSVNIFNFLPPLDNLLGSLGPVGQLALTAERQRAILVNQNISEQLRAQELYIGQDSTTLAPQTASEGPWTVAIPGVAYSRFVVREGNLGENDLQVRILPRSSSSASAPPSVLDLMGAKVISPPDGQMSQVPPVSATAQISYAQTGAQALIIVPEVKSPAVAVNVPNCPQTTAEKNPASPNDQSASLAGIGRVGFWLLKKEDGTIAHWGGVTLNNKSLLEPINVIILDKVSKSSLNATLLVENYNALAGYVQAPFHTSDYQAIINSNTVGIINNDFTFSDNWWFNVNNHGRLFGPVKVDDGYVTIGAFSKESWPKNPLSEDNAPAANLKDKAPACIYPTDEVGGYHKYMSFVQSRDEFAKKFMDGAATTLITTSYINLGNIINTSSYTTGDHDGRAVLLTVSPK